MLLEEENIGLDEGIETKRYSAEIIGESSTLNYTLKLVTKVAPASTTLLILGETGTGKEFVARSVRNMSPRKNKAMIKVNCAVLPANLIESE